MSTYAILAWQPLLRPPLPDEEPPLEAGALDIPLKALACRNQIVSVVALVTSPEPVQSAQLVVSDLACRGQLIPREAIRVCRIGAVPTPEAGPVCDPIYDVDRFAIERSAALHISIRVPRSVAAGAYRGTLSLVVDGREVAKSTVEVDVANVDLPDVYDWDFFLGVWMNPATVARWHGVELWSDEHFGLLRPYVQDLAAHGQKSVIAPVCYEPWGTQTRDPYPSLVGWRRRGENYEFDFSVFDRYVALHIECGIERAIHCYSIVQGPGATDRSVIDYLDLDTGERRQIITTVGGREYIRAWSAFLEAFGAHLEAKGWFEKAYIAFDEKPDEVMQRLFAFLDEHGQDFKTALAGDIGDDLVGRFDDLCLHIPFDARGVARTAPTERAVMGMAQLLDPDNACAITRACPDKSLTTFYVCCAPAFPNTFLFSPLVESRMLPFLAAQGGFDGFLRWSYNDWSDDPYRHPEWKLGYWPTGDTFFIYPGEQGPVSSLRWEQLREGIYDFQLAMIASANIRTPDEMVDYEQAITLACRNPDGRAKSVGDIELARRLLIPIAEHQNER